MQECYIKAFLKTMLFCHIDYASVFGYFSSVSIRSVWALSCVFVQDTLKNNLKKKQKTTFNNGTDQYPIICLKNTFDYELFGDLSSFWCFEHSWRSQASSLLFALQPVQNWVMAYSYLLNGICAKVLHCGLDERLLMLIPLPTTVSPTSPQAGRFFIV